MKIKQKLFNIFFVSFKIVTKIASVFLKVSKIALAGISFAFYSYLFTWKFAAIIMIQLFVHEYGHIWAMKRCGMKTKGIYFIPFLGGAAVSSDDFKSRGDEVFVALMGPVFGFACAAVTFAAYMITKEPFYAAGASWMAMINLFNLLPINPLDGGRVFKSIAFSINDKLGYVFMTIGILASIVMAFYGKMLLFIMVIIISSAEFLLEYLNGTKIRKAIDEARKKYFEECARLYIIPLDPPQYPQEKPKLEFDKMLITVFGYAILSILLFSFMVATISVPGAAVALEFLKD